MKVPATPIVILVTMCAALDLGAQAGKPDTLSKELAALLQSASTSWQGNFQYEKGQVMSGGKKATFTAVSEQALENQGRFIQAARIEVSVNAGPYQN